MERARDTEAQDDNSYDAVHYPGGTFWQSSLSNLSMVALMCGLEPPELEKPRVLEIGCGNGQNLLAHATVTPGGEFLGIDIASSAIAEANEYAADCQLENVHFAVADITDPAGVVEGEFDFIICHGVYAWVPDFVREAVMRLIGRHLSPTGVAYVSYNAHPGGHIRQIVREMAIHEMGHIKTPKERMEAAREFYKAYSEEDDGNDATRKMMRGMAKVASERPPEVIFHDELNDNFSPQSIMDFIAAANREGLEYLHDANGPHRPHLEGEGGDVSNLAVAHRAMSLDYARMTFFHWSLVVREGRSPARRITREALSKLWVSSTADYIEAEDHFKIGETFFTANDEVLKNKIRELSAQQPRRVPLDEFFEPDFAPEQILEIYDNRLIHLHGCPWQFPLAAGERPRTSNLVLQQIAKGARFVSCLDYRTIPLSDPAARSLVALLDGTRTVEEIEAAWRATGESADQPIAVGLWLAARLGLLVNPLPDQ